MAKQLNVSLNVTANTKDAKKNLEELSASLNKISTSTKLDINDNSLKEAKQAAIDLQQHLNRAINTDTGKLDLNKFSQSLSKAGQNLQSLHNQLTKIGPEGQQAFLRLAQSISQADSSALNLGSKITQLGTTLANTARWQASSSILHGIMGAIQGAYGYAQDLNKSLNNIRIVTGQNIDQMARFAEEANKASKALSTSTTSYTDAALIYYQQGLTGKEVTERTETTIKLANVSRQSAEEVSDQMTAIWNNFYDGSQSLEYYADVITKLGAATASSSDEISQGLQKFAAVADTVGLSYEKATAALATVVAETRQSADVVGTAFKTMFARFQGLQLGETLEDGVTLNKYSEALGVIGVNILDANGNLRIMDDILDDTAKKWNTITEAQQVALAETVAGTRQYAQFMAIMNNYDKILANQDLAAGAEGTLQKQADIYAESWEAASKRVRAAAQGIYQDLINDKFFITTLNGFEKFLNGINNVIDGLGGLKGILLLISSIFMQHYAKEMPTILSNLASNFNIVTGAAERYKQEQLQSLNTELKKVSINPKINAGLSAEYQMIQATTKMTMELNEKRKQLSNTEIEAYQTKIRLVEAYGKQTVAIGKEIDALNEESSKIVSSIKFSLGQQKSRNRSQINRTSDEKKELIGKDSGLEEKNSQLQTERAQIEEAYQKGMLKTEELMIAAKNRIKEIDNELTENNKQLDTNRKKIQENQEKLNELLELSQNTINGRKSLAGLEEDAKKAGRLYAAMEKVQNATARWQAELDKAADDPEIFKKIKEEAKKLQQEFNDLGIDISDDLREAFDTFNTDPKKGAQEILNILHLIGDYDLNSVVDGLTDLEGKRSQSIENIVQALGLEGEAAEEAKKKLTNYYNTVAEAEKQNVKLAESQRQVKASSEEMIIHTVTLSEKLTQVGSLAMQVSMAINALKNIGSIWSNEDLSDGEKLLQLLSAFGTLLPVISTLVKTNALSIKGLKLAFDKEAIAATAATGSTTAFGAALSALPVGWILAGLAAIVGAIYLIAKIIETPAEKLKRLKKEQENLREATEKANEEWEKFQDTLSSYDEGLKGLQELTKGTVEFNEQLEKVNETAEDLINTLSLVFGEDYYFDTNGAKVFTQPGRKKIEAANSSVEKGQSSLNWINLLSQNEVQKAEYEDKYGKTKSDRGYYARERGYDVISSQYDQIYKQEYDQLYTTISDLLKDGLSSEEISAEIAKQYSSLGFLGEDSENILKNASSLTQSFLKIIDNVNQVEATPFHYDYNQESAWIASQLDLTNPYSQIVAQNAFNSQEQVENDLSKAVADYNNKQEDEIEDEWEQLFGALADKGESLLESGISKREYLAQYSVGQEYLQQAEKTLAEIANINFSKNNNDVLTQIATGNLQNISPEQMANFNLEKISQTDVESFGKLWELLYGQPLDNIEEYLQRIKKQTYNVNDFYRTQIIGLDTIQENVKDLNKAFGSLKLGDAVEDISDLSEEMQSYFVKMEDGTFKLVGDAEQFQAALFRKKSQSYENDLQTFVNLSQTPERYEVQIGANGQVASQSWNGLTEDEGIKFQDTAISYAMTADSLQQLNYVKEKFNELNVPEKLQIQAVNVALQDLATKYNTCKDELDEFQFALTTNNDELIATTRQTLEYSIQTAELAEKMDLAVDDIEDQARAFQKTNEELKTNVSDLREQQKVATKMAVLNQSMNKGVSTLSKNWKDWNKILQEADKDSMDYIDTIQEMRTALSDLLGITNSELIPKDFFENKNNLELMGQAAEGDAQSINLLGTAFAKASIEAQQFAEGMNITELALREAFQLDLLDPINSAFMSAEESFNYYRDNVLEGISLLEEEILNGNLEVGADLTEIMDGTGASWVDSLNQMAIATGMSVDEMRSMLNALGIEAEIGVKEETVTQHVPRYHTTEQVTEIPNGATTLYDKWTTTVVDGYDDIPGVMEVAQINMGEENSGKQPKTIRYAGRSTPTPSAISSGDSGGSGSEKDNRQSAKEYKDVKNEIDRYHVLNEQLDDLSSAYNKASKAKDRLFGKDRLQAIQKEQTALDKLIKHNQAYLSAANAYREQDKNALLNGGLTRQWVDSDGNIKTYTSSGASIDLQFDEEGALLNYEEFLASIIDAYNQAVDEYNNIVRQENVSETEVKAAEDTFKQAELQYELIKEAFEKYEESNQIFQDKLEEIRDQFREQQDKRFEEWSYKLELKLKIIDEDKKYLEYFRKQLDRFSKSIYAPVTELLSIWNSTNTDSDWKILQAGTENLKNAATDLMNATHGDPIIDEKTGELLSDFDYSQEDWMSALDDVQDKIYEQIDALYELDETMSNYYSETLSEAETKLDQYMTKMEDCTAVIKHFQTILSLLGKEQNYEWTGEVLEAQRETIQNELQSSTKEYELAKQQYDIMLARYEADKNNVDEGTRELMERELQAQYESMSKWHEKMLSKTEEYAEVVNAIYENTIKKIGKAFEEAATSGQGWESLLNSLDRVSAYQDLILTRTNQVYETNKLMRKLSQDIDKTNNIAAKTKLANFKQEIQDMQNLNRMSKFDLDVANARYEVLKAQIALEEAQNAKSTVRLQRDSEGNYGYVYTADQDLIDDAEQTLADKTNDLYNLTLNKANENARALAELDQEMYAELERIALEFKDDEVKMQEERNRVIEEFAQRRSVLVHDYAEADYWQQRVSVTQTNEAYGDAYKQNLLDTEDWQIQVSEMVGNIDNAYSTWTDDMDTYVRPVVGTSLEELKQKTDDLRDASEKYQTWFDNFADTNNERLEQIAAITNEYFNQRQEVELLIEQLQIMADKINDIRASESGMSRVLTGSVGYDPNVDYSALMHEYLENGGKRTDSEYLQLQAAREAKIDGEGYSADYYGARGQEFENLLDYYMAHDLTGTFAKASQAYASENGDSWQDVLNGNTEAQKEQAQIISESTGILKEKADEIMERASLTSEENSTLEEKLISDLSEQNEELTRSYQEIKDNLISDMNQELTEANDVFSTHLDNSSTKIDELRDSLSNAASDISAAAGSIRDSVLEASGIVSGAMSMVNSLVYSIRSESFDTGGYTGSWGSSGKIAMLHEKELVLNATDTANILSAIDVVRQLNSEIDLRAAASNISSGLNSPAFNPSSQTLEQEVTIHAEFPNATDHSEIEEAFNNLINRASQYANRSAIYENIN